MDYKNKSEFYYKSELVQDKVTAESLWFTHLKEYRIDSNKSFFKCGLKIIKQIGNYVVESTKTHRFIEILKNITTKVDCINNNQKIDTNNTEKNPNPKIIKHIYKINVDEKTCVNINKKVHSCDYCQQTFAYKSGKSRHQNYRCHLNPNKTKNLKKNTVKNTEINEIKDQINSIQTAIESLLQKPITTITNQIENQTVQNIQQLNTVTHPKKI